MLASLFRVAGRLIQESKRLPSLVSQRGLTSLFARTLVTPKPLLSLPHTRRPLELSNGGPLSGECLRWFSQSAVCDASQRSFLARHFNRRPKKKKKRPLDGAPIMRGVVLRVLIKKPKKPNSANRKVVWVRLTNGKEKYAYVPGVGHNLQEHNQVLVRCGRLKDVPGVQLKCIRGKLDLPLPIKRTQT